MSTPLALAWSSDDEEDGQHAKARCKPRAPQLAAPLPSLKRQQHSQELLLEKLGPPSLQGICVGVLGDYLGELLECAPELLALLPSHHKNCVMAIARRRGLLDDRALAALADEGQACLDCHGTPVGETALRSALAAIPQLQYVDLTGCHLGPATLRLLGERCPLVEVLRIGGAASMDVDACARALLGVLPQLEKEQHAEVDSWEALYEEGGEELAAPSRRLMRLRCLAWPGMPFELRKHCGAHCPLLVVNPTSKDVVRRGLPAEFDPATALDAALFAGLADAARWEQAAAAGAGPDLHIAEKFRLAYLEQAQQLRDRAERAERRWRQQRRREVRRSPAEQAIRRWLEE